MRAIPSNCLQRRREILQGYQIVCGRTDLADPRQQRAERTKSKKDKTKVVENVPNALKELRPRKVVVDLLGRMHPAND